MKINYPKGLYADVRVENVFSTSIRYTKKELTECKEREYAAAFIRVYDGQKWYYSSTSNLAGIQDQIDALAKLAKPNAAIADNAIVKKLSCAKDKVIVFDKNSVAEVPLAKKAALLDGLHGYVQDEAVKLYTLIYTDSHKIFEFYNSLGAAVKHDYQMCAFAVSFQMSADGKQIGGSFMKNELSFDKLTGFETELKETVAEYKEFMLNAQPVEPGKYTMLLSPKVTGLFTHEIFGHKSEADFMQGDEAAKKAFTLGRKMGISELNIIDTGTQLGSGYVPYDDEGHKARVNYIIKDGILTCRLHNTQTAVDFDEEVTANARGLNYEFEPQVRMTNTYIDKGTSTYEQLLKGIKKGIYVKNCAHGSGGTTFTMAPTLAYMIEDGKITKPVRISVITGSILETLADIDGISDKVEISNNIFGGCGKMGQGPMHVADGGPYVRVNNMNVN